MSGFDEEALAEVYNRGLELEKAGDLAAAAEAYRQALVLDPEDHCGASIRLAAMGAAPAPDRMPDAYVATLFDQHADVFEAILVDQLQYCVPLLLREQLRAHAPGPYGKALDLGCGTGLTGEALADICDTLTGVDLSERIIEIAFDREVYADLYVGEAVEFLEDFEEEDGSRPVYDLIAATDVMPYLGRLERVMAAAAARLSPGGVFGFSTETLPEADMAGQPVVVGPKRRYAHDPAYVRAGLQANGFTLLAMDAITVRLEDGEPVPGHLVLARRA
ncbi:methyltransferase [Microvirga tunisiensis]|uniref:Methyltransferase n=2 Tax=Pannonibacter tanglangensis TaxID=2750084 RepID=A0ABW9ZJV8_9HYPH|nr:MULTISPECIES: methyltransferase [unclassified Pannonibacter]NBN64348.1 methyltransferase [Pannonibacter sp. XCT-34]NBN78883.1 methyltransferase [Pannonibacter sp. XCT-53]